MINDTMTQADRLSRSAQGELNDGLTDEQGNNVGVGLPHDSNDNPPTTNAGTDATAPDYDDTDDTGSGNSSLGSSANSGADNSRYAQTGSANTGVNSGTAMLEGTPAGAVSDDVHSSGSASVQAARSGGLGTGVGTGSGSSASAGGK